MDKLNAQEAAAILGVSQRTLRLSVKGIYFQQMASGEKVEEFRLRTGYWRQRLEGRTYDRIEITLGYPPTTDTARLMTFKWKGCRKMTMTHPHFGESMVDVYAIDVSERIEP
jgi:hypothetical protein